MSILQTLERNRPAALAAAVAVIAAAAVLIARQTTNAPPKRLAYAYFYRLDAGQLTVAEGAGRWSLDGGKAVRAMVFSCGRCDDAGAHFVGYLQKLADDSPEAEMVVAAAPQDGAAAAWLPIDSDAGVAVTDLPALRCEASGRPAVTCAPLAAELP